MVSRSYLGRISRLTFIIESNYHRFNRFIVRFSTILFLSLFLDLSKYRLSLPFVPRRKGEISFHDFDRRIYSYIYMYIFGIGRKLWNRFEISLEIYSGQRSCRGVF